MKKVYAMLAMLLGIATVASAASGTVTRKKVLPESMNKVTERECVIPGATPMAKAPAKANSDYTWVDAGTVTFTEEALSITGYYDIEDIENVPVEEAQELPGFYRLKDPYKYLSKMNKAGWISYGADEPYYMYVHTESGNDKVWFETFFTGATEADYGDVTLYSQAGRYIEAGNAVDVVFSVYPNYFGSLNGGKISFPAQSVLVNFAKLNATGLYYANPTGAMSITFPGAKDYSVGITSDERCVYNNAITATLSAGADVASIKYAILGGRWDLGNSLYSLIDQNGLAVATTAGNHTFNINATAEGDLTLFVIAFDEGGNVVNGDGAYFFKELDHSDEWASIGTGVLTDGVLRELYNFTVGGNAWDDDMYVWEVEVEENIATPGYYRVKNAYSCAGSPFAQFNTHATDHNHYIYFHTENGEDKVTVDYSCLGVNLGYGLSTLFIEHIGEVSDYYKTSEYYGTLTDRMITFPLKALVYYDPTEEYTPSWYYANKTGKFALELPKTQGVVLWDNAFHKYEAPHVHYTLDGETYELPIAMERVESKASALGIEDEEDEGTTDVVEELWSATIPLKAVKVKFSDGVAGEQTEAFNFEDGVVVKAYDPASVGSIIVVGGAAEYYNLQGVKVPNPIKGGIYIIRKDGKTIKVVLR